ncbi:hypothetical protein N7489_003049 [Penicillium chrysogenum]|uniref:Aminoglycoside phosphotransferase domain-containing protein n=1 Tax=Penicillium chrysogenum TaxID=5076 RepID=A0ABQ8W7G7_PENCH|nr:uncharacterized protein N7489_003049 [Penicillium chrysogenum]KAJ5252639.1 hypothetical protein N7489_003049 [Penicillium chrysogenum]KAJ5254207.1 hypothetical protein N7524_011387 [Penicillium chrysogenum]KAJ5259878.1 hypothetical protein N7505_009259 [Penicillium chrysogenum]KAJ6142257.1 hypothetical protein N7497_011356 [Penicillium chrysogenum]
MTILGFSELYIGTEVTFATPSPQKWVIEEKLTEDVQQMSKWELDGGAGPPFAVFKYLCHSAADGDKKAFMRIYFQIPIEGTEHERPEVRQRQAASRKHRELDVLKDLQLRQCPVVPSLLAYKEGKQGNDGPVPDGYITHIVWDKVPGKSLSQDEVWDPKSGPLREAVRAKFRDVWEVLRRYGWKPGMHGLEHIIYDEATQTMHIAGFRQSASLDPEEKFTDMTFVGWGLAIAPSKAGWDKDSTKWAW